jgi:hypothetical protein
MPTSARRLRLPMRTSLQSLAVFSTAAPFGLTLKTRPLLPLLRPTLPPPSASAVMATVLPRPPGGQGSGLLSKRAGSRDAPVAGIIRSNRTGPPVRAIVISALGDHVMIALDVPLRSDCVRTPQIFGEGEQEESPTPLLQHW